MKIDLDKIDLDKKYLFETMIDGTSAYSTLKIDKREDYVTPIQEDYDPYALYDEMCGKLNKKKDELQSRCEMAEMGCVVESNVERPIIATQALDTCYGILFYDRRNRYGVLGHAAPSSKDSTVYEMLKRIDDGTPRLVEYFVVPGFRNIDRKDLSGFEQIVAMIRAYKSDKIRLVPFNEETNVQLHKGTLSYEFGFDTSTGEFVTRDLFFEEIENNPRFISDSHKFGK